MAQELEVSKEIATEVIERLVAFDDQLRHTQAERTAARSLAPSENASGSEQIAFEALAMLELLSPQIDLSHQETATPAFARVGRFQLIRCIGAGGFALVYLAVDPLLAREVALKAPRALSACQKGFTTRFATEARAAAKLDHPHIVPIYEMGVAEGIGYIAMAYCKGPTLAAYLSSLSQPMTIGVVVPTIIALTKALAHSHAQGVLHCDLKPSNVLLFPQEPSAQNSPAEFPFIAKIADFGLAKFLAKASDLSSSSTVLGTPVYMAPEQVAGRAQLDERVDIYGLGAILYEMLSGRPPFTPGEPLEVLRAVRETSPPPLASLREGIPASLAAICAKSLAKAPQARYASAAELLADLHAFAEHGQVKVHSESWLSFWRRFSVAPARIHEAGAYTFALNTLILIWMWMNVAIAAFSGFEIPPDMNLPRFFVETLVMGSLFHGPCLYFGALLVRGRKFGATLGALWGAGLCLFALLCMTGAIPTPFGSAYQDPLFRIAVFGLVLVTLLLQVALCLVARRALVAQQPHLPSAP